MRADLKQKIVAGDIVIRKPPQQTKASFVKKMNEALHPTTKKVNVKGLRKTTIYLPPSLDFKLSVESLRSGKTRSQLVSEILERSLELAKEY